MATLKFSQIEKRYGDRVLLNIEALSIPPASCILITGNNGSGKTTLLKILSGLLVPERGQVTLDEKTVSWSKGRHQLLKTFVYVHQTPYMLDATVSNNIAYGLKCATVSRRQVEKRVADALRWANLDHLAYRNARLLSAGEKQQVALTRSRIIDPGILALDEPAANLDRRRRNEVYSLIARLRDDGISVLVASHDVAALSAICDQHWHLEAGRMVPWERGTETGHRQTNVRPFPRRKV